MLVQLSVHDVPMPENEYAPCASVVTVPYTVLVLVLNAITVTPGTGAPFIVIVPENDVVGGGMLGLVSPPLPPPPPPQPATKLAPSVANNTSGANRFRFDTRRKEQLAFLSPAMTNSLFVSDLSLVIGLRHRRLY
jgi:hypothetical protein